jgi:hypothetical protein
MPRDRQFKVEGGWGLATDGIQWILLRRSTRHGVECWNPVSFVRSTRDILVRCMREKGVEACTADLLLAGPPDSFDQWKTAQQALDRPAAPFEEAAEAPDRPAAPTPEAAEAPDPGGLQPEVAEAQ